MSPDLGSLALCGICSMGSSRTFLSGHQSSRVVLYVGCVHPSAVLGMTSVGVLVGRGSPHPPAARLCLMWLLRVHWWVGLNPTLIGLKEDSKTVLASAGLAQ